MATVILSYLPSSRSRLFCLVQLQQTFVQMCALTPSLALTPGLLRLICSPKPPLLTDHVAIRLRHFQLHTH